VTANVRYLSTPAGYATCDRCGRRYPFALLAGHGGVCCPCEHGNAERARPRDLDYERAYAGSSRPEMDGQIDLLAAPAEVDQ
jgi:hypothetical protein